MATPEAATATMIRNLAEKTGKTLEQWVAIARKTKLARHGEIVAHLKAEHGLGHGYANLIALTAREPAGAAPATGEDLVAAQYAGPKAALRPIHDAVVAAALRFGADVEVSPKKTCVSLRRGKQFALIQPSTATRVDLGINLKGVKPTARLEESGSFSSMVSHRVRLGSAKDVDAELIAWMREAYSVS